MRAAPTHRAGKWRLAVMQTEAATTRGSSPSEPALRIIMRRLREIMAEPSDGQSRLDKIVRQIAGLMVAEVCSIYLKRQDGSLELFATEGLNPGAVHNTLMKRGEGLVGRCAELAVPINEPDAQNHPAFSYRPETGEEIYHSFLAVPILRGGDVLGVLTVQNKTPQGVLRRGRRGAADHGDGAGRASGVRAPSPAPTPAPSSSRAVGHVVRGQPLSEGLALGHVVLHEPRVVVTELMAEDPEAEERRLEAARRRAARPRIDEMLEQGELAGDRRAPRRARGLPHVRPRPRLAAAHEGGDQARPDGRGRGRARAERHPRAHAAPDRCLLARAAARPRRSVRPPAAHPRRARPRAHADTAELPHDTVLVARTMGAGRPARLRPHAAARPGARGWRRPEPRRHRRQGAGHRRRRQCARRHGARRPRRSHHRRRRDRRGAHPPVERGHRRLWRQGPLPRPPAAASTARCAIGRP